MAENNGDFHHVPESGHLQSNLCALGVSDEKKKTKNVN